MVLKEKIKTLNGILVQDKIKENIQIYFDVAVNIYFYYVQVFYYLP